MNAYEAYKLLNNSIPSIKDRYSVDVQNDLKELFLIIEKRAKAGVTYLYLAPGSNIRSNMNVLAAEFTKLGYNCDMTLTSNGLSIRVSWDKLSWKVRFTNFFTKLNRFVNRRK